MVLREDGDAVVAVGQPSHAWVSGQLARAWGNERFGAVAPREEVCLAAEQHDVGMARWDLAPALNRSTGRPQSFMEMELGTHLELWSQAPDLLRAQSRYAALLVSLHGTALYERRDPDRLDAEGARAVRAFLERSRGEQAELLEDLRRDPAAAGHAESAAVARNQRLLWTWDSLSLALLLDWAPHEMADVPAAEESLALRLSARNGAGHRLALEPWPFSAERVELCCEGRRLEQRYEDEAAMQRALRHAPPVTLAFELTPGSGDDAP